MVNYQRLCPTLYIELAYVSERRQVEEATYHRVLGCSPALAGQLFQLSIWRHGGSHSMWTCVCVSPPVALTSTVLQMSWPVIVTYSTGDRRGKVSTPVPPRIQIDICEEWLCTKCTTLFPTQCSEGPGPVLSTIQGMWCHLGVRMQTVFPSLPQIRILIGWRGRKRAAGFRTLSAI